MILRVDRDQVALQGLQLGAQLDHIGQVVYVGPQVGLLRGEAVYLDAAYALSDDAQRAVGGLEHLLDAGEHSDSIYIVRARGLDAGVSRRDQADQLVLAQDVVDELAPSGVGPRPTA